jgi:peptidoglycan/xylan/chitin deacetylase (PgdA/CDA1 family)
VSRSSTPLAPRVKRILYKCARLSGVSAVTLRSSWRRQRLLILCYHGISLDDEHQWRGGLYIPADHFRRRMQVLKESGCSVLPIGQALDLLQTGSLPARSVVITFDDGYYDFYAHAWPILREMNFPVTLYFNTFYSEYNVPIFDLMSSYLLWKAGGRRLEWPEMNLSEDLDGHSHDRIAQGIQDECLRRNLTESQKTALLCELAGRLGVDYEDLCRRRMLHLMNTAEAADLVRQGVDFQLHGHWHRVSRLRELFRREIERNAECLSGLGVKDRTHYCYPAGFHLVEFPGWLQELGVRSAVTCEPGMATSKTSVFRLPRLLDSAHLPDETFAAWVCGVASWFPSRKPTMDFHQLLEREVGPRIGAQETETSGR